MDTMIVSESILEAAMSQPDRIYADKQATVNDFEFNQEVVQVFDDMIGRSVPYYRDNIAQIVSMSCDHAIDGTRIYDLGCSLGACTLPIAEELSDRDVEVVGVDSSAAMIDELQSRVRDLSLTLVHDLIQNIEIENASVVILNYTLQFVPVEDRAILLQKIADGTVEGGILLLSEKITGPSYLLDELFIRYHHDFKRQNGYSDLEIAQKRQALENVMITETAEEQMSRMYRVGYSDCCVWQQFFNFASFFAKK